MAEDGFDVDYLAKLEAASLNRAQGYLMPFFDSYVDTLPLCSGGVGDFKQGGMVESTSTIAWTRIAVAYVPCFFQA